MCSTRRRVLGMGATALAAVLAACGGAATPTAAPAKPTEAPKPAAPAAAPTTAPAAAPTTAPAAAKPAEATKPAVAAAPSSGAPVKGGSLKLLMRSHFVPAFDTWLDKWAPEWGAKNGIEIAVDHILAGELPPKWAAEVAANAGHDLFGFTQGGAINVYNKQLVDLSEIAIELGKKHGDWIDPLGGQLGKFQGVWRGVPDYFIDFPVMYRKDLFEKNNLKPTETWEDLLKAGQVLKASGNPVGLAINQKSNDANNSWHSLLWSYGISYATQDGKMASLNTPEAKDALKFAVELYNKTMTDEVLSWDDTGNNQGMLSGRIAWSLNPISALLTIEKEKPDLAKNFAIQNPPGGPKGRFASVSVAVWGVMNWSKSTDQARAFLGEYFNRYPEGVKVSGGYNQPLLGNFRKKPMPILGEDPRLTQLQDFHQLARVVGHPGPPTPAAAEVESNWIIPLMVGRAIQGSPDDAIKWAQERVEQIYKKHGLA